jgi:hypothetical protein
MYMDYNIRVADERLELITRAVDPYTESGSRDKKME